MKTIIPINTARDDTAFTITARYGAMCETNLLGGGHYPMTAILEIQEIEMEEPKIMQIGSYSPPSSSCNAKVLDADGICPTLLDHKGAEPAIIESPPIKIRQATAQGYIECPPGGGFDAAYPNSKLRRGRVQDNGDVVGALTASGDEHCVYEGATILGYTRDDKGNVQSYHEKEIAGTLHTSSGQGGNTDQFVKEPCGCYDNQFGEFAREPLEGLSRTVKTDGHNAVLLAAESQKNKQYEETNKRRIYSIGDEANSREILSILWQEIGEETIQKFARRFDKILNEEILRHNLHEESICQERTQSTKVEAGSCVRSKDCILDREPSKSMRDLRSDAERGYTPQGWQSSEQYLRELDACLSELSHEAPQTSECLRNMWQRRAYSPWYVRQTLHSLEKVWRPQSQAVEYIPKVRYRIRKLTGREAFRLMGVDDSDIDKLKSAKLTQTLKSGKVKEKPMSKTQLYKMAGNSIVVDVLYHIFHQMFIAEPPKPKPIQKSLFDQ